MSDAKVTFEGFRVARQADLVRRVGELNKRAKRLQVPELRVSFENVRLFERTHPLTGEVLQRYEVCDASVVGDSPVLAGWRLAASLDHDGPETIIGRVPGFEGDLAAFRNAGPFCAHCGARRRRLQTFIVAHVDGRLVQVGRDCIGDFLGHASPEHLLFLAAWVSELAGWVEDDACHESHGEPILDPVPFLAQVAACIRVDGWVSRTRAREFGIQATASDAWELCLPPSPGEREERRRWCEERAPQEADKALAYGAFAWACNLDPEDASEYLSNVGRLARKGYVKSRDAGLLASAVAAFSREQARQREQARPSLDEWFGTEGNRERGLVLTLLGRSYHETQFGTTCLLRFADAQGRLAKSWASGAIVDELRDGETYTLDATVKAHTTWRERRETQLSRIAFAKPPKVKAPRKPRAKRLDTAAEPC